MIDTCRLSIIVTEYTNTSGGKMVRSEMARSSSVMRQIAPSLSASTHCSRATRRLSRSCRRLRVGSNITTFTKQLFAKIMSKWSKWKKKLENMVLIGRNMCIVLVYVRLAHFWEVFVDNIGSSFSDNSLPCKRWCPCLNFERKKCIPYITYHDKTIYLTENWNIAAFATTFFFQGA